LLNVLGGRAILAGMAVVGLGYAFGGALDASAWAAVVVVTPGDSIQAAIDASRPGDTVALSKGVYHENLYISKGPLVLRGPATLRPAPMSRFTPCDLLEGETPVGICVYGSQSDHVTISQLHVDGFRGSGILAGATVGLTVERSRITRNGGYGVSAFRSRRIRFVGNVALGNRDAAYYVGRSPTASAVLKRNVALDNNAPGILFRSASGGVVVENRVGRNCAGIVLLAHAPGPANHLRVTGNHVYSNSRRCRPDPDGYLPVLSGLGVGLVGARNTVVTHNIVSGNRPSGRSPWAGGIVLIADRHGGEASSNIVSANVVMRNRPFDLRVDEPGTNRVQGNRCGRGSPTSKVCPA
jgi:nitrous oxidase accessory protein NosD